MKTILKSYGIAALATAVFLAGSLIAYGASFGPDTARCITGVKGFVNIFLPKALEFQCRVPSLGAGTSGFNFPTSSLPGYTGGDVIYEDDVNELFRWVGTRVSTDTDSIAYKVINTSSSDPGHKHTTSTITDIDYVKQVNEGGTATTTFARGIVTASGTDAFGSLQTNGAGSLLIASGTQFVANTITAGSNTTVANAAGSITLSSQTKFGGTGADGALTATSGTSFDLGGVPLFVRNFTSFTMAGTSTVSFTNPSATGTIVVFKISGDLNVDTTTSTAISVEGIGAAANTNGFGLHFPSDGAAAGTAGLGWGDFYNGITSPTNIYDYKTAQYGWYPVVVGGGGGTETDAGGRGGGCLYFEVNGTWDWTTTSTIDASGVGTSGRGGGGAGGCFIGLYNTVASSSQLYDLTGGSTTAVTGSSVASGGANRVDGGGGGDICVDGTADDGAGGTCVNKSGGDSNNSPGGGAGGYRIFEQNIIR